ncbi:hypothetical protein O9K51_00038 [Purpureocillium lavendulum]|uniref:Beta-glucuronidase C-terminal domain-containing protein n=1 Tax=Purpureocillium lavendulum TaxID=1247861 RepID=A0AB34G2B0_9HYPO|nr:hypothetical protein O9K51_00038 [Purpureocillium lavendulum]
MKAAATLICGVAATHASVIAPQDAHPVPVPPSKPGDAFVVPKDFVGFGIESAFLNNFDNDFSDNLVSALAARMSEPPVMRIGGTSGDYFLIDPSQKQDKKCVKGKCDSHAATYMLGPSFFDGYKRFKDAKFILQAPLCNPINITNTLDFVTRAWKNLDNGKRVKAIALGNEVEFIYKSGPKAYVDAALKLQDAIVKKLGLSGDAANIFEAGNTASGTITGNKLYKVPGILNAGINKNGRISAAAEHWYQISGVKPWTDHTMQTLMINHTAIAQRFNLYTPSIKASQDKKLEYAITEDAAVLGGAEIQFSDGFGYALWAADFNLAAMARGVARVANLAGRPNAKRVFWTPDDSGGKPSPGPQVRAPFPAAMFIADFIGKGNPSAVKEIKTKTDLLSAYAMYDDKSGKLQRVALMNMRLYNGTTGTKRGRTTFQVNVGKAAKQVKVRHLRADQGVAAMGFDFGGPTSNVSWAGEQWSHGLDMGKGHFRNGKVEENTVQVKNGVASVVVPDSEAVMLMPPGAGASLPQPPLPDLMPATTLKQAEVNAGVRTQMLRPDAEHKIEICWVASRLYKGGDLVGKLQDKLLCPSLDIFPADGRRPVMKPIASANTGSLDTNQIWGHSLISLSFRDAYLASSVFSLLRTLRIQFICVTPQQAPYRATDLDPKEGIYVEKTKAGP